MNKKVTPEERAFRIDSFFSDDIGFMVEKEKESILKEFDYVEFSNEETKEILFKLLPASYYFELYENYEDDESSYNYIMALSSEELEDFEKIIDYITKNLRAEILKTAVAFEEEYHDEEEEDFPSKEECYWGTGYHVGSGVYCDEDGDNWEF